MIFKKYRGFLFVTAYYLIGIFLSVITYEIFGHPYIHAPGLHHILFLTFMIGGFILTFISAFNFGGKNHLFHKESIIAHGIILGGVIISLVISFKLTNLKNEISKENQLPSSMIINVNDSIKYVVSDSDTVYMMKFDSIVIDKINLQIPNK
ncbi:hypothetical protein [Labilibacter marinus]|uniref:hypothetical protein n=1 Tax=Labilibacter marinus TaxID=1477105 RepID=UPI00082E8739|nr:hypothetical protein [Labilibacter marinus]